MDLNINGFPSQLLGLAEPIADVLLPLNQIALQPFGELIGFTEKLHFL